MDFKLASYYLSRARTKLGDDKPSGTEDTNRWSDAVLLEFLNEGVEKLASMYRLAQRNVSVEVVEGKADYDFTDIAYEISRVEFYGRGKLIFISRLELDRLYNSGDLYSQSNTIALGTGNSGSNWQEHTGTPTHVVYDKTDVGKVRLYPVPDEEAIDRLRASLISEPAFGETVDLEANGLNSSLNDLIAYDKLGDVTLPAAGSFGIPVLADITIPEPSPLQIFFDAKFPEYSIGKSVEIDDRLKTPLVNYIIAEALLIGNDTENRDLARVYMGKFEDAVEKIQEMSENEGADRDYTVDYNNGFNLEDLAAHNTETGYDRYNGYSTTNRLR